MNEKVNHLAEAMNNVVTTTCYLQAVMDGMTINGFMRVEHCPLVQRFIKGTNKYVPDFETMSETEKPVTYPVLRDSSSGEILVPDTVTYKYNGKPLTFDEHGLSTNEGMEGIFQKVESYPASIDGQSYPMTVVRVVKNLVPISGYDNDRISASGTVEKNGQIATFNEYSREVIITDTSGGEYSALIVPGGLVLTDKKQTLEARCDLFLRGEKITDLAKYSYKWFTMPGGVDTPKGTSQTQTFTIDDVNYKTIVRVEVYEGSKHLTTAYDQLVDYTEPVQVRLNITGIEGTVCHSGQTAHLLPKLVNKDGTDSNWTVANWNYYTHDNEGKDFKPNGKEARFSLPDKEPLDLSYTDFKRAKMGILIDISGEYK